jgi:septal ring factor EnvC (AmiA/AmiB activator)
LRRELAEIERRLLEGTFRESDLLEEIDAREQQISLQTQLIRAQKRQRKQLGDSLRLLERSSERMHADVLDLASTKAKVEQKRRAVQSAFARHLNSRRRLSRLGAFEFLLGARSLPELLKRRQVLVNVNRFEERYLTELADQSRQLDLVQNRIGTERRHLEDERERLEEVRRKVVDTEDALHTEQERLKRQQSELAADLSEVRGDRTLLQERQAEIQQALRRIEEMIASARAASTIEGAVPGSELTLLKGMLPWPVDGDVLSSFGLQRSRAHAGVTDNPGVDIAAASGEEVRCIADGRVSTCTWLRGFGNVVIVEHPGDFFTVYAHLQQLDVGRGDKVRARQVLGTAAHDGVTNTYRVHFELWQGKEKHNPLLWLAQR